MSSGWEMTPELLTLLYSIDTKCITALQLLAANVHCEYSLNPAGSVTKYIDVN